MTPHRRTPFPAPHGPVLLAGRGLGAGPDAGPTAVDPIGADVVASAGWRIPTGEVSLPVAVLRDSALRHNLDWMRAFTQAYGVELAPHGKTTMSPELFAMQLQAGARGSPWPPHRRSATRTGTACAGC